MEPSHKKIVDLANKKRLTDKTREQLNSMSKEVLNSIRESLGKLKNKPQNPWKFTVRSETKTGSLYRGTAVEASSDIDVVVVLNYQQKSDTKNPPSAKLVLERIHSSIPKKFQTKINKRSVKVSKKVTSNGKEKTISMDVVPAIVQVNSKTKQSTWWHGVSKVEDKRGWIQFNPTHQKEIMEKLKRRIGQKDDPTALIICLKYWRDRQQKNLGKLPSYILEVLVWEDYKQSPIENDLTVRFNRILTSFKRIHGKGISFSDMMGDSHRPSGVDAATGKPLLHDPSNTSVNLVSHLSRDNLIQWGQKAQAAADKKKSFKEIFGNV